jgi:hypothetical protein
MTTAIWEVVEPDDIARPTPGGDAKKNSAASLCPLLRDPGGFVPLRLKPLCNLLRCLPCLKGTHAHTVKPNLIDRSRGEVHRIAGLAELIRQRAGFFQLQDGSNLHGIAGRARARGIGECTGAAEFSAPALLGGHR